MKFWGVAITVQQGKEMRSCEAGGVSPEHLEEGGKVLASTVTIEGTLVLALRPILCLQCHFDLENKKEEKAMCTAARPVSSRLIGSLGVEVSDA